MKTTSKKHVENAMPCIILHLAVYRRICQVYTEICHNEQYISIFIFYINVSYELCTVNTQYAAYKLISPIPPDIAGVLKDMESPVAQGGNLNG